MIAIRKLQYDPARYFYPMPDLEHLHTVLTMSTTNALMMMNPSLAAVASATPGMQGEAGARGDYRTRGKFVHLVQSNLAKPEVHKLYLRSVFAQMTSAHWVNSADPASALPRITKEFAS